VSRVLVSGLCELLPGKAYYERSLESRRYCLLIQFLMDHGVKKEEVDLRLLLASHLVEKLIDVAKVKEPNTLYIGPKVLTSGASRLRR
ncbi:hypothetical protein HAX54_037649, partial [Datura stramonium]|nr:hypothetical protein [Datura stramonium]